MKGKLSCILLGLATTSYVWEQNNKLDNRDTKYLPCNLPDIVLTKRKARTKISKRGSSMYPNLKFSILIALFFVTYLLGPYVRFGDSFVNITLFAAIGYSTPNGVLYQGDAVTCFVPLNLILAAQGETYTINMFSEEMSDNTNSFAFEGGIIFGSTSKIVTEKSFTLFLRYTQGGGYDYKTVKKRNGFTYETITKTILYDAQLFEIAGVFRKPWGIIDIIPEKLVLYFTTDFGFGALQVKEHNKGTIYTNFSFVVDLIWRFYMGIAFYLCKNK